MHWTQDPKNKKKLARQLKRMRMARKRAALARVNPSARVADDVGHEQLRSLARLGAQVRLEAIAQEIAEILKTFPELKGFIK